MRVNKSQKHKSFDIFGIRNLQNWRAARKEIKKLKAKDPKKGTRAKKNWQKKMDVQEGITRREFTIFGLKAGIGIGLATLGTSLAICKLTSKSTSRVPTPKIPKVDLLSKYSDLIRRILFDLNQKNLDRLVKTMQKDNHARKDIVSTLKQVRTRVEEEFRKEAETVLAEPEKLDIKIWGEKISIIDVYEMERANQVLRKIGSDKRIYFGYTPTSRGAVKDMLYGKIRREERIKARSGERNKYIIIFAKGGTIVNSQGENVLALTDALSTTVLLEDNLWESIEGHYDDSLKEGSRGIQFIAKELFKTYGISSRQQLMGHEKELLQDSSEFVLAHERGHFEVINRVGSAHKNIKSVPLPKDVFFKGGKPISYFFVMDELIADLASLEHLASIAKIDPMRGKKLILLYTLLSASEPDKPENLEHALYRAMGFAVVQSALIRKADGSLEIDLKKLFQSIIHVRKLAEKDLRSKNLAFKAALRKMVGSTRAAKIEKATLAALKRLKVPHKLYDQFITQYLFVALIDDQHFLIANAKWQSDMLANFERYLMKDQELLGPAAGKFEFPLQFRNAWLKQFDGKK